jgi:hypothetical protein
LIILFECYNHNKSDYIKLNISMTALFEKIIEKEMESFFIGIFQDNLEKSTWHYHNNFEISFRTEGSGKRMLGDSILENRICRIKI